MCFNILLLSDCLLPGQTSCNDRGVSVSLKPENGETVLCFSIDNSECQFKKILGLNKPNMAICDFLVFYAKKQERIICFVELKGSGDLSQATEQVINTYNHFNTFLQKTSENSNFTFTPKAFLQVKGSVPKQYEEYKEKLRKTFGEGNYEHNGKSTDFGDFLRGIPRKSKGKRKKY